MNIASTRHRPARPFSPNKLSVKERPKVVVLGGGYAGTTFVDSLGEAPVDVTLIDKSPNHVRKTKIWKATVGQPEAQRLLEEPLKDVIKRDDTNIKQGEVEGISPDQNLVLLSDGSEVSYDYLVVALGSKPNFHGNPDWAKHVLTSDQANDAKRTRETIQAHAKKALAGDSSSPLKFVVVGGGATGVEQAGVIHELVSQVSPALLAQLDITLVNTQDKVLKGFPEPYRDSAMASLAEKGIKVKTGHRVDKVEAGKVHLKNGEVLKGTEILWGGGIEVPGVLEDLGGQQDRSGRVTVDQHLRHPEHQDVYIIGDAGVGQWGGQPIPADVRSARQEGAYVAQNIRDSVLGQDPEAFLFTQRTEWTHFGPIQVDP